MGVTSESGLLLKLRDSALVVLRRHGVAEDELQIEENEPGKGTPYFLIRGHRVRIHVDDRSASFSVRSGRWSGARVDYPTAGAFIADLEAALHAAFTE